MYSKCENLNFHYHHFLYRDSVTRFWTFFVVKNLYSRLRLNFSIWRQQSRKFVFPRLCGQIISLHYSWSKNWHFSNHLISLKFFMGFFHCLTIAGKTELIYLQYRAHFIPVLVHWWNLKKNVQNVVHTVKNRCFLFLIFFEGCKI